MFLQRGVYIIIKIQHNILLLNCIYILIPSVIDNQKSFCTHYNKIACYCACLERYRRRKYFVNKPIKIIFILNLQFWTEDCGPESFLRDCPCSNPMNI